jgi:hypothetical protein
MKTVLAAMVAGSGLLVAAQASAHDRWDKWDRWEHRPHRHGRDRVVERIVQRPVVIQRPVVVARPRPVYVMPAPVMPAYGYGGGGGYQEPSVNFNFSFPR